MRRFFILACGSFLLAACNHPGKESFELGRQLERQGRVEEAITLYEEAITKEQDNQDYRTTLSKARSGAAGKFLETARKRMQGAPVTYDQLRAAQLDVDKALKSDPSNSDAKALAENVKTQMDTLLKKAETLYSAAGKAVETREWATAINRLRELAQFYPGYLDIAVRLPQTERAALT